MILADISFPPWEYVLFGVMILLSIIGKFVEFWRKFRRRSIEAERRGARRFGADLEGAPAPPGVEAPPRLEIRRRPPRTPRPRREEAIAAPPPPPTLEARDEHPIVRVLRAPHGTQHAILLAEILGPPKALLPGPSRIRAAAARPAR